MPVLLSLDNQKPWGSTTDWAILYWRPTWCAGVLPFWPTKKTWSTTTKTSLSSTSRPSLMAHSPRDGTQLNRIKREGSDLALSYCCPNTPIHTHTYTNTHRPIIKSLVARVIHRRRRCQRQLTEGWMMCTTSCWARRTPFALDTVSITTSRLSRPATTLDYSSLPSTLFGCHFSLLPFGLFYYRQRHLLVKSSRLKLFLGKTNQRHLSERTCRAYISANLGSASHHSWTPPITSNNIIPCASEKRGLEKINKNWRGSFDPLCKPGRDRENIIDHHSFAQPEAGGRDGWKGCFNMKNKKKKKFQTRKNETKKNG